MAWLFLIALIVVLMAVAYLYIFNKPTKTQKHILGTTINIPNEDGFGAKMTSKENINLKGPIKNLQTGKKSSGEVVAYLEKIVNLSDDGSSFIMPFEINYQKQNKYTYLGIFYSEPTDTSIIGKNDSPKIIKNPYSYLLGENITVKKIDSFTPGSYSYTINIKYLNDRNEENDLALRSYYEKGTFEIAKTCEEVGTVITKEKSNGEKYDICVFDDSHECTLKAYKKGNCPVNGYDVSKTNNPIEKWGIAEGFLFKNGNFIFPANYMQCTIDDFYFNKCKID